MTIADLFDPDAEQSAFAMGVSWQAEQLERVVELRREMARLEAEEARILAGLLLEIEGAAGEDAIDAGDPAAVTRRHGLGVRSLATELAAATNTSLPAAQSRLGESWTLVNELRETLISLEVGEISRAHARELIAETEHLGAGRLEAERALLPWARKLPVAALRRKAKRVLEALEKEPLHVRHERAFAKRRVEVSAGRDGMAHLEAYLDAADAAVIRTGLENAAAEARALGDSRTAAQSHADLLIELLHEGQVTIGSSGAACAPERGPEAERRTLAARAPVVVEVLIPAATLAGDDERGAELVGGGVIDPRRARELIVQAPSLRRILTDPITSATIDFDRSSYRIPAELKRDVERRDGHCRAPGCTAPVSRTEIDHTTAYARGGPTALWNLVCLCSNHHHLKHEAGWSLKQYSGGILDWRSPSGRSYRTYPENPFDGPPDVTERAPFDV